jgi:phage/plasmid-like protein (TIGR03299 family)
MAHQVETMAFANQVPWHGLGNRVNPDASVEEMLKEAGLDWDVNRMPLFAKGGKGRLIAVPGRSALVRSTDDKIMTIIGPNWKPLQNRDMMDFFRLYTEAGKIKLETAGALKGGRVIFGLANLGDSFTVGKNDKVQGYLLIISPHEVGMTIRIKLTTVRVVCANTLAAAISDDKFQYSQSHLRDFDVESARAAVEAAHDQLAIFGKEARALAKRKMTDEDTVVFLSRFFQPLTKEGEEASAKLDRKRIDFIMDPANQNQKLTAVLASVRDAPGATPGNAWGVLNGVLHWADHSAGRSVDARMTRAWLGDRGRIKTDINSALLAMAA